MAVRPVLKMGDPRLLQPSMEITPEEMSAIPELLEDLWDTMAAENGAGLAAPQIGVLKRVVVFGYQENPRYPDAPPVPETVLINPIITPLDDDVTEDWEGCLSVPGMRGLVPRAENIRYQGIDEHGNRIDREVSGFHARVVQHECDHLDGILYPFRITDLSKFGFQDTLLEHDVMRPQPCDDPE